MKRFSLVVTASMLAVFCSGIVVGALGHRLYSVRSVIATEKHEKARTPQEWRQRFTTEMNARLKMSDSQLQQLNTILDDTRDQFEAVKQRGKADMKQIHDSQVQRIRAILSDPQKTEYDKMMEEREKRRKEFENKEKQR